MFTAPDVDRCFQQTADRHGNPAIWLSDNGAVFTGRYRGRSRVALEITLHHRGITAAHSRPYHPQTCGKIERFHQTQKRWLTTQPRAVTIRGLQAQLEEFQDYYNSVRPHRALGRRTPLDAYQARPKATPTGVPLDVTGWRVRHDIIDDCGKVNLRHGSRLHHIGIGRRHRGRAILILVKDLHVRISTTDGETLRDFELDPNRDYQPQPKT